MCCEAAIHITSRICVLSLRSQLEHQGSASRYWETLILQYIIGDPWKLEFYFLGLICDDRFCFPEASFQDVLESVVVPHRIACNCTVPRSRVYSQHTC